MSEAYTNAKADSETLTKLRGLMFFNSLSYLWSCYLFAVHPGLFGFKGLIYANNLNLIVRSTSCMYFAVQHEYEFNHKKKRPFYANFVATVIWMFSSLFCGKVYLLLTTSGVLTVFVAHYYILPWILGSLWVLN